MGWQNTTGKLLACNLSAGKVHGVQSTVSNILAGKVPAGNVWVGKLVHVQLDWRATDQRPQKTKTRAGDEALLSCSPQREDINLVE